jgi:hypothetical protein
MLSSCESIPPEANKISEKVVVYLNGFFIECI